MLGIRVLLRFVMVVLTTLIPPTGVSANSKEKVLYSFTGGSDGRRPYGGLISDASGKMYGVTRYGGTGQACNFGCGVIFKESPRGMETVLYNFSGGDDGCAPEASLNMDATGNMYGTATGCGAHANGTVFKLSSKGRFTLLYTFVGGADGARPVAPLIMDQSDNLLGTAIAGGDANCNAGDGCGVVFKLSRRGKLVVLHTFHGSDGANPQAGLIMDGAGNFYGTTNAGGTDCDGSGFGCGVVFKLAPKGKETVLHFFAGGSEGKSPIAPLIMDQSGNLYGTTLSGGIPNCDGLGNDCGVVFRIAPDGTETVLHTFMGNDGELPDTGLIMDSGTNLYGATSFGGIMQCNGGTGCGVVYKLSSDGTETVLHAFSGDGGGGDDGGFPIGQLRLDAMGTLYGVTNAGGPNGGYGTVFRVTP